MRIVFIVMFVFMTHTNLRAFDEGWIFNIVANVGGSSTTPLINDSDLSKMGASYMKGMTGFVNAGEVQIGYLFDMADFVNRKNIKYKTITNVFVRRYKQVSNSDKTNANGINRDHDIIEEIIKIEKVPIDIYTNEEEKKRIVSGFGVFGSIGVGQGYAGQISGANVEVPPGSDAFANVDVFFNVHYTPVISVGAMGKLYFLENRLALGLGIGAKVIADTSPQYDFYSTEPETLKSEVGTIIVDSWMIKNMNPVMFNTKVSVEYNQPLLDRMEIILGGYIGYDIYKPKYITMPPSLAALSTGMYGFDPHEPLNSFYLNSLNYGIVVGLGFKI